MQGVRPSFAWPWALGLVASTVVGAARSSEAGRSAAGASEAGLAEAGQARAGLRLFAVDGAGLALPAERVRASLGHVASAGASGACHDDATSLRFVLVGTLPLPAFVSVASRSADGAVLAVLRRVALASHACPADIVGNTCGATPAIRAVVDALDAEHPAARGHTLVAALGGALVVHVDEGVRVGEVRVGEVRVAGPRRTPLGPIERLRARLRFVLVRAAAGEAPPLGRDESAAAPIVRAAVARANSLWGACGLSFGPAAEVESVVVDPPPSHLVAIGCEHGLPATGGTLALTVNGTAVEVRVDPGMTPGAAARRLARAVEARGFRVALRDNPRISAGFDGVTDLSVRTNTGELATLAPPPSGSVSRDATLGACIGAVELEDGLQHFGDADALTGTLEERALLTALDDLDPRTIDVVVVPGFARGGRIGESFIVSDGGAARNVVLLDRMGVYSSRASSTLAHELGHVLLDDPGHADDYAGDTPTRLMDADASDATAFGPRRLVIDECVRALRASGPRAKSPLLSPWPLEERWPHE